MIPWMFYCDMCTHIWMGWYQRYGSRNASNNNNNKGRGWVISLCHYTSIHHEILNIVPRYVSFCGSIQRYLNCCGLAILLTWQIALEPDSATLWTVTDVWTLTRCPQTDWHILEASLWLPTPQCEGCLPIIFVTVNIHLHNYTDLTVTSVEIYLFCSLQHPPIHAMGYIHFYQLHICHAWGAIK